MFKKILQRNDQPKADPTPFDKTVRDEFEKERNALNQKKASLTQENTDQNKPLEQENTDQNEPLEQEKKASPLFTKLHLAVVAFPDTTIGRNGSTGYELFVVESDKDSLFNIARQIPKNSRFIVLDLNNTLENQWTSGIIKTKDDFFKYANVGKLAIFTTACFIREHNITKYRDTPALTAS